jgi:flagellar hook-associated protein 3 FlgL
MSSALSLRFSAQAQADIQRLSRELSDLQRQVASGNVSNDLSGFGEGAARLLNTQGVRSLVDARASAINQVSARFDVQSSSLGQAADASTNLAKAIHDAISANDGRGVELEVNLAFTSTVSALNETWNGQPLFAGERVGGGPVTITSLDQLVSTPNDQIYDEAARSQTMVLGPGAPIELADRASEISQGAFDAMRDLKVLLNQAGGQLGAPLTSAQIASLQDIANRLDSSAATFNSAEGRSGQLSTRLSAEYQRLQDRSALLLKESGEQSDADLAQVSVRINSLLAQYQAAAKTFSDLSQLSLLSYL